MGIKPIIDYAWLLPSNISKAQITKKPQKGPIHPMCKRQRNHYQPAQLYLTSTHSSIEIDKTILTTHPVDSTTGLVVA